MIRNNDVFKIGIFNKPHGVKGELQLTFTDDIFDRSECDYIVCKIDGLLVPFFMEKYRFKSDTTAFFKLEGIDTAEKARSLVNAEIYFPKKYAETVPLTELTWNSFIGYRVMDDDFGCLGEITNVENSTINTLFIIDNKEKQFLVPAQEDFILDLNQKERTMLMHLPDGLLDLDKAEGIDEK